jgi:hypothetical protein
MTKGKRVKWKARICPIYFMPKSNQIWWTGLLSYWRTVAKSSLAMSLSEILMVHIVRASKKLN